MIRVPQRCGCSCFKRVFVANIENNTKSLKGIRNKYILATNLNIIKFLLSLSWLMLMLLLLLLSSYSSGCCCCNRRKKQPRQTQCNVLPITQDALSSNSNSSNENNNKNQNFHRRRKTQPRKTCRFKMHSLNAAAA